jgi:hypothetical protein
MLTAAEKWKRGERLRRRHNPAAAVAGKGREGEEGEGGRRRRRRERRKRKRRKRKRRRRVPLATGASLGPGTVARSVGRTRESDGRKRGGERSWNEKLNLLYIFVCIDFKEKPEKLRRRERN